MIPNMIGFVNQLRSLKTMLCTFQMPIVYILQLYFLKIMPYHNISIYNRTMLNVICVYAFCLFCFSETLVSHFVS